MYMIYSKPTWKDIFQNVCIDCVDELQVFLVDLRRVQEKLIHLCCTFSQIIFPSIFASGTYDKKLNQIKKKSKSPVLLKLTKDMFY